VTAPLRRASQARSVARRLALQALYRWQLNECPWQDLVQEFADEGRSRQWDPEYFEALVRGVCAAHEQLDAQLAPLLDRAPAQLDPIEHGLLLMGVFELQHRPDVPWRVIVNEAVGLARRFGATDGHRFVNAVLDQAARRWRTAETQLPPG